MDKVANRKAHRINGDKKCRINTSTGILANDGTELLVGDYIFYKGENCIVLFNIATQRYEAMLCRTCWYGEKDLFDANSYGKSYTLPIDNGAKMQINRLARAS